MLSIRFSFMIFVQFALATIGCVNGGFAPGPALYFAYATDQGGAPGTYAFSINANTGSLTQLPGSPYSTGAGPFWLVVDSTNRFLYVDSINIYGFSINSMSGALTAISGSPFSVGGNPIKSVIEPTGHFLYTVDVGASSGLWVHSINQTTGALTTVATYLAGLFPIQLVVTPSGKYLYVSVSGVGIYTYSINSTTGSLSQIGGVSPEGTGQGMAVDPTEHFLYVADSTAPKGLYAYTINQSNGAISLIAGSPFSGAAIPDGPSVGSFGNFLFVPCYGSIGYCAYTINTTTGVPTLVNGSPFPSCFGPFGSAFGPNNAYYYSTCNSGGGSGNGIYAFSINSSTGALTALAGSPFPMSTAPFHIVTVKMPQPRFP